MEVFVTGVAGQLGHDVVNELAKRGYEGVGSDIAAGYSGVWDRKYRGRLHCLRSDKKWRIDIHEK